MSVQFVADDRILLEEIVESIDQPEADLCGSVESVNDGSVTTIETVAEVADTQEPQPQQQQQLPQSKGNVGTGRRIVSQNVASSNGNDNSNVGRATSRSHMEQEKRMRREIANSNERRRMQSINAGFQSLRQLLPHHEGEKLSKAAILQQTAEYIYQLEQEKTQLLSQNSQLKRLINQHEGDVPIKKRKPDTQAQGVVVSVPMHVSESGDEGLGSMSPEPLSVITVPTEVPQHSVVNPDVEQLKRQLERERHARLHLEKQMRAIQTQLYPERFRDNQLITYQPHEVIEHTDNVLAQETEEAVASLQVVSVMALPPVGSNQTVETSSPDPSSPPLSPQPTDMVTEEIKKEIKEVTFTQNQVFTAMEEPTTDSYSSSSRVTYATSSSADFKTGSPQYITTSPTRSFSPAAEPQRLPSVLEAAMKAEPKVEVERLPSPSNSLDDGTQTRLYIANTSRQNLETIVEAIRHLEGDHLFSDEPAQDMPLALTNKQQQQQQQQQATANSTSTKSATTTSASSSSSSSSTTSATATPVKQRILHADHFLQFHTQQQTQQRPGVIVVKHS
ncbi:transcription factor cropped [Temnothorax americanus]|uniref:transcription factor cropped n=1 Tax=Temnothorax americanus TaxID=1964332 RepID=UPI0040698535